MPDEKPKSDKEQRDFSDVMRLQGQAARYHGPNGPINEVGQGQELGQDPAIQGVGRGIGGVKDDKEKLRYDLLPWRALDGLVSVLTFGARKYAPNGWRIVPNGRDRYIAALLRHLSSIQKGEKVDKESGLRHIDHLLCNAAFLSELED